MSAPDRSQHVRDLCAGVTFPPLPKVPPATQAEFEAANVVLDAWRLNFLKTVIIPSLNGIDGGQWGLMTKTDQGNKVPCDILMWQESREHIDCLTATGAQWTNNGVAPIPWVWTAVYGPTPEPPNPNPIPPAGCPCEASIAAVNANINQLRAEAAAAGGAAVSHLSSDHAIIIKALEGITAILGGLLPVLTHIEAQVSRVVATPAPVAPTGSTAGNLLAGVEGVLALLAQIRSKSATTPGS